MPSVIKKDNKRPISSSMGSVNKNTGVPFWYAICSFALAIVLSHHAGKKSRDSRDSLQPLQEQEREQQKEAAGSIGSVAGGNLTNRFEWVISEDDGDEEDDGDGDEDDHETGGNARRHLLLDLGDIATDLIDSTEQAKDVLEELVNVYELELLAHTCYYENSSHLVSCAGLVEGGHIAINAYPDMGSVLLDLFFVDVNEIAADRFENVSNIFYPGQPNKFDLENAQATGSFEKSVWRVHRRGSRETPTDLDGFLMEAAGYLHKVASVKTSFQQVDVFDHVDAFSVQGIQEILKKEPAYMEANPRLFSADRTLFLDGVLQSTRAGDAAYHEALVQPSMFAHENPKRVAIVGGGECATLREVLKHRTVEKVVMVEIDPGVIEVSKYALPDWNDCSNIRGSSRYCMDDPRAQIYNEDAFAWFIDRYLGADAGQEDPFDVIIVDALDPQNVVDFAKALYGDNSFLSALYHGLSHDGILITQVGNAPRIHDPAEEFSTDENRNIFANSLVEQGFQSILDYEEAHTGFDEPWLFYAAFKSNEASKAHWQGNSEAYINLEMQKRAIRTIDGTSPFEYFDGSTMVGYQQPSKGSVAIFCRRSPTPVGCHAGQQGFDPNTPNYRMEQFVVHDTSSTSSNNESMATTSMIGIVGPGIFATTDIPVGSYLMLEKSVHAITMESSIISLIDRVTQHPLAAASTHYYSLDVFVKDYGHSSSSSSGFWDRERVHVNSGISVALNHRCDGGISASRGECSNIIDSTEYPDAQPKECLAYHNHQASDFGFNPARARGATVKMETTKKHIRSGEEVLEHYCNEPFGGSKE